MKVSVTDVRTGQQPLVGALTGRNFEAVIHSTTSFQTICHDKYVPRNSIGLILL